jgi:hypothetical protein
VLLPVYPKYTTTTTVSRLVKRNHFVGKGSLVVATGMICDCAADHADVASIDALGRETYDRARSNPPGGTP